MLRNITQIFSRSSMHGVQYIADPTVSKKSKVFWSLVIVISLFAYAFCIYKLFDKFTSEPEIGLKVNEKPISELEFPSITICPEVKAKSETFNYFETVEKCLQHEQFRGFKGKGKKIENQDYFEAIAQICQPPFIKSSRLNATTLMLNGSDVVEKMKESQYGIDSFCHIFNFWGFKQSKCSSFFTETLTHEGVCGTFNLNNFEDVFNAHNTSEDFNYRPLNYNLKYLGSEIELKFPYHIVTASGNRASQNKIDILLKQISSDEKTQTCGNDKGFRVYWHRSNELPSLWHNYMVFGIDRFNHIKMKATAYNAAEDLRKFSIEKRQCFFPDEVQLEFFQTYTKRNCELECFSRKVLNVCNCSMFFMPRYNDTPVCDLKQSICYIREIDHWKLMNKEKLCNCYPSCSDVKYHVDARTESLFSIDQYYLKMTAENFKKRNPGIQVSRLTIAFYDPVAEEHEKFVSYKIQHLLCDMGGLLGLFMGCSILSFIEFVYFFITFLMSDTGRVSRRVSRKAKE